MFTRISTTFECTVEQFWDEISRLASLRFVAAPLLHFEPLAPGELDSDWVEGKTYALRLTVVIWAFAHLFDRHRQRRWKMLLCGKSQGVK